MPATFIDADVTFMHRALALARRAEGWVEPNPMVGCVLVRRGQVVGEGYHRRFGRAHAEVHALRKAGSAARNATAYVTLEPCCYTGKTPPCTEALIAAGVARVIAAHRDPNPRVAGRGLRRLQRHGIAVACGLLAEESLQLNRPWFTHLLRNRAYVVGKWAQSIDGRVATRRGDSQWISGVPSRRSVHQLRGRVDAIMTGIGTVLHDDPSLTARDVPVRRVATRIVADSQLRLPRKSQLVRTARDVPVTVLTTRIALQQRAAHATALARQGVNLMTCRTRRGRVDLADALARLAQAGMTRVLVEGGPRLLGALHDEALLDEAWVYTAPLLIGGAEAPPALAGQGPERLSQAWHGKPARVRRLGEDTLSVLQLTSLPRFRV